LAETGVHVIDQRTEINVIKSRPEVGDLDLAGLVVVEAQQRLVAVVVAKPKKGLSIVLCILRSPMQTWRPLDNPMIPHSTRTKY
jgi:hypothetical protein